MSEREDKFTQVGDREVVQEHLHILGFTFFIGAHSISEEFMGFSPLWFPQGKYLCLLSLVIIFVHAILSENILDHID